MIIITLYMIIKNYDHKNLMIIAINIIIITKL